MVDNTSGASSAEPRQGNPIPPDWDGEKPLLEYELADLRAQLEQVTRERDEALKLNVADEWKLQCTLAENRLLLERLATFDEYDAALAKIDACCTAVEVERVQRLERAVVKSCRECRRSGASNGNPETCWYVVAAAEDYRCSLGAALAEGEE